MGIMEIKDLCVTIDGKEILKGVNLKTGPGEVHAIMGPNGSGKSTLAYTLLGHPKYQVTKGDILLDGESILKLKTDERAKKGLFLGFQYPTEVSGVGFSHFLRTSYNALSKALQDNDREVFITVREFQKYLKENVNDVGYPILLDVLSNMGFVTLLFSALIPLNYMGGLMVFAMLSTSIGTLTLLASLIEINKKYLRDNL